MSERAQWGSRLGFVLAASGSAVGLGNVWKFPYITGENGGGLFVLIYLVCIALVGVPILMAEIMIGRAAQRQTVAAFHELQGGRTAWATVGWLGLIAGFLIASFYIVVAGWAMDYTLKSVVNFTGPLRDRAVVVATERIAQTDPAQMRDELVHWRVGIEAPKAEAPIRHELKPSAWEDHARVSAALAEAGDPASARARLLIDEDVRANVEAADALLPEIAAARQAVQEEEQARFAALSDDEITARFETFVRRGALRGSVESAFLSVATDGWTSSLWAMIFMLMVIMIVAMGVASGIERVCTILMPTLVVLMVIMVIYGAFQPGFGRAMAFIFKPDPSKLEPSGVLEALGHAFFTLSLGMGAMITYGSYQRSKGKLASESITIAVLDTAIALLACMMIFPITFSFDQEPSAGPGLVFMSLPLAFAEIGRGGMLLAILFFGLLVFAAITSAIGLLEVIASYFIDVRGWARSRAAWLMGGLIFALSVPSAFALDAGQLISGWEPSYGQNFFDTMDYLTSNWMLPLGGLLIALYAGWVMPRRLRDAEVADLSSPLFLGWLALIRFVAPALVVMVLLQKVGIVDVDELLHGLF